MLPLQILVITLLFDFPTNGQPHFDPRLHPVSNLSDVVNVNISYFMKTLVSADIRSQVVTSLGWLQVTWFDTALAWSLDSYPATEVSVPPDVVWKPDLTINNLLDKLDKLSKLKLRAVVSHTGQVTWEPGAIFQTSCAMDITYFPFDIHWCFFEVSTWSNNAQSVHIAADVDFTDLSFLEKNSEWMVDAGACETIVDQDGYDNLKFNFRLKRKVKYYILGLIVPIILVSTVTCLLTCLSDRFGEKMSVEFCSFVAFLTYQKVVLDTLPRNSNSVCFFGLYIAFQLALSSVNIFASVLLMKFRHERDLAATDPAEEEPLSKPELSVSNINSRSLDVVPTIRAGQLDRELSNAKPRHSGADSDSWAKPRENHEEKVKETVEVLPSKKERFTSSRKLNKNDNAACLYYRFERCSFLMSLSLSVAGFVTFTALMLRKFYEL